MKVAVLMGGMSREREISLKTGRAVMKALEARGHQCISIDPGRGIAKELIDAAADIYFIALHGRFGEDGTIQGLLELLGLPYTGSGVMASAVAMDKVFTKRLFMANDLPTPRFSVVDREDFSGAVADPGFDPPYFVKPSREGSSIGVGIANDRAGLEPAVRAALAHDRTVLIEEMICGTEVTVGIIGRTELQALPPIEIVPSSGKYDYASKYTVGATEYIIPPRLPASVIADCKALGLGAHRALGCSGVSRVDMMIGDGGIEILEVNTIPGMTETSLLPKAARAAGIDFGELLEKIIEWGLAGR